VPTLRFVLNHLAKPPLRSVDLTSWSRALRELASADNVVAAKLSGLVTEANWREWTVPDLQPSVDVAIETFGPARLMFGSDWPVCLVAASYGQVLEAARTLTNALSESEKADVFHLTALRSYGLSERDEIER
jgi:L-fuconolactonase